MSDRYAVSYVIISKEHGDDQHEGIHWGMFLSQGLYLMEAILMAGTEVRSLERLSYVILVVSQMRILLVILGKFRWEGYLVHIVFWGHGKDKM